MVEYFVRKRVDENAKNKNENKKRQIMNVSDLIFSSARKKKKANTIECKIAQVQSSYVAES